MEVKATVPEVLDLAGLGSSIHLPMKTYSSGMGARLRFAISAAARPEVLLIDEALATGDAKFRRRSEQRVRDLRAEAGTVFLVSHSEQSIRDTCERAIWLESGEIRSDGPTEDVLKEYEAYMRK
jgi:teichoic acid transport system ATP-binding protein